MTLFLILLALTAVAGIVWTLVEVARDGYRRRPTVGSGVPRDRSAR